MKQEIIQGNWKEGMSIPTEASLCETFNASRVTVRQAIKTLVDENLLYKVQGSGTYVSERMVSHDIYRLKGFTEEMGELSKKTKSKIITFSMQEPPDFIQHILNLSEDEHVFFIRRLRLVDDIPLVVEDTYLPVSLFPDLSYEIMLGSKYDYIEKKKGFKISSSHQQVLPIMPSESIRELLRLEEGLPILKVELSSMFTDETVFEYTELYFKSDEYKFTITATRNG
ncbi:GntR family transcriptional regulator [Paenalkalicoccus suaedae]|uniref:GntR family transcriptional regulator n=2 Tax=Paenalkalicoccus suaedae TaxID=2592382 RepID=A0A859FKK3_9BACI|nr:GntR family transcriptional regulator [Paenalkalicoccus suaedae]